MKKTIHTVGLTGGIGSGKSLVGSFFKEIGIDVFDADEFNSQILSDEKTITEIADFLGKEVVLENGQLNRLKIREKIFCDKKLKERLESITHPKIKNLFLQSKEKSKKSSKYPYFIYIVPLLFHYPVLQQAMDEIVLIDAPVQKRLNLAAQRDKSSLEQIKKIMTHQLSRHELIYRCEQHYIIYNLDDYKYLKNQVVTFHRTYLKQIQNS